MEKINRIFEKLGAFIVCAGIILGYVIFFILLLLFAHPVGWVILSLSVCKMFGVI